MKSFSLLFGVVNSILGNLRFLLNVELREKNGQRVLVPITIKTAFSNPQRSVKPYQGLFLLFVLSLLTLNSSSAQNITIANGQTITISTNTTYTSLTVNNGGTLIIQSPATLTVGAVGTSATTQVVDFQNGSIVNINAGAFMVVNGKLNNSNNSDNVTVDGDLYVAGNYQGGQGSEIIGNGTFNSSGTMTTAGGGNPGLIFGSTNDCSSGPCNGNSLCGRTATATASVSSVCSGTSVTLTGVLSGGGTKTYQWQSSDDLNGTYANLSTSANVTITPTASKYYRVRITVSGCVTTSNTVYVQLNTNSVAPVSITGTGTICSGTSTVLTETGGTLGSGASAVWYEGTSCTGGFTEDWLTQSYSLNETTVNSVNGILNVTSSPSPALGDPMIFMNNVGSFNPNTYKYINIKYKVNSGSAGVAEIFFINTTYPNATAGISVTGALINDGNWHVLTLDMSTNPSWTTGGNIKGWRFDYCNNTSINMDIDYISLTASTPIFSNTFSPPANKSYVVRYEGFCNTTACSGSKSITVNPTPTITGTTPNSRCGTGTVALAATGSAGTVNWYTVSTGGTAVATGTSYTTPSISSTTTYYVDATNNGCTTATRTAVIATVNNGPTITPNSNSRCGTGTVALTASASAGTISWYAALTGGSSIATGTSYTTPSISTTTTYYLSATSGGCTNSPRIAIVATVNTPPTITGTTPNSICGTGTVTLGATASAGTVNWYTASTGGTAIATGTTYTTPTISATTTYYVDATNNGCTTASRTAVAATINPIPAVYIDNTAATICSGSSVTLTAAGDPGKALSLSGSNQYIQLNNDPLSAATDFTFEANIYWTNNSTQWQRIFDFGNSTTVNMFFTTKSSSGFPRYAITTSGNGGEQQINTTTSIGINAWHHVAITYNASAKTGIMYIDGVAVGTNTNMTLSPASLTPKPLAFNYLGESQYPADPNFAGQMDEIRIWDVTRTAAEINANKSISVDPNSADLVAYYKLNEGSGSTLTSVSGSGTATLSGSPTWVTSSAPVSAPGGLTTTYAWSPSTGLNTSSGATVVATPTSSTVYTVTATYSNSCTSTATSSITVKPTPTITATTPNSRCSSGTVTLGATASAGTVNWYTAATGGTAIATGTSYTTPSISTTTTYYVDATNNGCTTATRTAVIATVTAIPTITATAPASICGTGTVTLGATASAGTVNWFTALTGGTAIATGATYTTPSISGNTTYYVSATDNGCTTASRTSIVATVNTIPTILTTTPNSRCGTGTVTLSATRSAGSINWYTAATGGTSISTGGSFTTPSISTTTTYYVDATSNGCTTASRTAIVATVTAIPTITSTTLASICGTGTVTLGATASAGTVNWYTALTLGTAVATGTSYTTPSISTTTTYYVDATDAGCTTGARTAVVATVTAIPTITATAPNSRCGSGPVTLGASRSAGSISWYTTATGGTSISTGGSYTTPSISTTTTYYVDATDNGCTSASRTAVVATVTAIPTITATTPASICGTGTVALGATASAGTVNWYTASTGGTAIATGTSYTTPSISTTTTYYVDATDAGCTTGSRTAVAATVNTIPTITATTPNSSCGTGTVALGATASLGTVNWYTASTGGTAIATGTTYTTPSISTSTTYYVDATNNGCTTASRTAVLATVNTVPTITATTPNIRCGTGTLALGATASSGTVNWYTASTGGTAIATGTSYTTPSISTTTTYYVDATLGGCTTGTRTAVTATIDNCIVTWTGAVSSDWNTASNWSKGSVPLSSDTIVIPSGVPNYPIIATAISTNKITINSGASFNIASTGTLSAQGNIINNGTFTTVAGSTLAFTGAYAQTMTGVSGLHNMILNNTSGGVSLNSPVTVKGTISLTKGVLTSNSNLTINFDLGGNIAYSPSDAGSISGTVSGRRDVNYKTHYICSPFDGSTSAQVAATTPIWVSPYWKMYARDFATQNWSAVINTTTAMPIGKGFTLSFVAPAPLILSGTYNHSFTLTTPGYSNAAIDKYFIFGNPYPSTIDWESSGITKTNVQGAIYFWDGPNNRSASYVAGVGTNGATQYIPAMQSVLVATTGTGGTSSVSINNNARYNLTNPSYFRTLSEDLLRVKLISSNPALNDETVIRFNEMATNDFDMDLDASKILNTGIIPNVYTMSGLTKYSINSYVNKDSAKVIPLYIKLPADGMYTLNIANSNPGVEYVLVDKQLGLEQSITESYTYSGLKTDSINRFELQLRESLVTIPTGIQSSNNTAGLEITSSVNGFVIKTDRYTGAVATIEIMDVTGNRVDVLSDRTLSTGATFVPLEAAAGTYLVKINVGGTAFSGVIVLIK